MTGKVVMLEPYWPILERKRADTNAWAEVAYREGRDADGYACDENDSVRYGVLLCLQYDRRPEDHALVQFLLGEETTANRKSPLEGCGLGTLIAGFLLARFHDVQDVWRMLDAKFANFDTLCGFDTRFLLATGVHETLEFVRKSTPKQRASFVRVFGTSMFSQAAIDAWWEELERRYPEREEEEQFSTLMRRAVALGATEEGHDWLNGREQCGLEPGQ